MSSPSSNNEGNDAWLMKIELKREEPGEINKDDRIKKAMEEHQEVTSRLQARFTMEELQSSAIPNSAIPPNARFISYENMKESVTCFPEAMQHPWVKEALTVADKTP